MTVPTPAPDPSGGEAQSSDHASCGLREAAAWIRAWGVSPAGLSIPDGANAQAIAGGINSFGKGFHAIYMFGPPLEIAAQQLAMGRGVITGVYCTPNAEPTTAAHSTANHWLATFRADGASFNCWEQTVAIYGNLDTCHNPGMGTIAIWPDAPPAPPVPQGEDDMGRIVLFSSPGRSGAQDTFQLTTTGALYHKEWSPKTGFSNTLLGTGYVPSGGIAVDYSGAQTRIAVERADDAHVEEFYRSDNEVGFKQTEEP